MKNLANMKIPREQFDKARKTFVQKSLSDSQKSTMLSNIYISESKRHQTSVISPLSSYFFFFKQKVVVTFVAIILILSGTTYVSAQSLPGDLLYLL